MGLLQNRLQLYLRTHRKVINFCVLDALKLLLQAPLLRVRLAFRPRPWQALLWFNSPLPLQPRRSRTPLTHKSSRSSSSMKSTNIDFVSPGQHSSVLNLPSTLYVDEISGDQTKQAGNPSCQLCLNFLMRLENY